MRKLRKRKPRLHRLKQVLIWTYAAVIVLVSIAMYSVLRDAPVDAPVPVVEEPEVVAVVLSAMNQRNVTVPIQDIEKLIPIHDDPAWKVHAAVWHSTDKPKIAIVIDDLGLAEGVSDQLSLMPGPYTLAYLPYAERLPEQTGKVRAAGHELMVHLPMQPKSRQADPGPNALLSGLSVEEFERRIVWNLRRFGGFVGVNNHMGSHMTEQAPEMVRLMVHLKRRGYLYLDSLTSSASVGIRAARATGVPTIARDVFLDNIQTRKAILIQLDKTERIARARGYAIAICHPYDVTLDVLKEWQASLASKGLEMVPLSQLVALKSQSSEYAETAR